MLYVYLNLLSGRYLMQGLRKLGGGVILGWGVEQRVMGWVSSWRADGEFHKINEFNSDL